MDDYIKRLKQIREERGLSIEQVSKDLEIPEGFLALIELGELIPTEKQLNKIMEYVIDQL